MLCNFVQLCLNGILDIPVDVIVLRSALFMILAERLDKSELLGVEDNIILYDGGDLFDTIVPVYKDSDYLTEQIHQMNGTDIIIYNEYYPTKGVYYISSNIVYGATGPRI